MSAELNPTTRMYSEGCAGCGIGDEVEIVALGGAKHLNRSWHVDCLAYWGEEVMEFKADEMEALFELVYRDI